MKKAILALADGTTFEGTSLGATGEASGEVVFNTSMTGYQEILTDPSYVGQVVCMTYPEQGNYGVNRVDEESARQVSDLLFDLNRRRGLTLLIVTHNPELAARTSATFVLEHGRLRALNASTVNA